MNKPLDSFSSMLIASSTAHFCVGPLFYGFILYGQPDVNTLTKYIGTVVFLTGLSFFFGFLISLFYGIAIYKSLTWLHFTNYFSAITFGAVPGVIQLLDNPVTMDYGVILFGIITAVIYHKLKSKEERIE